MFGCGGVSVAPNPTPTPPPSSYQVITISDLHFNPLYDPSLFSQLSTATDPATQWPGIFETSKVQTPTGGGTDTNYPLLAYTLASLQQTMTNIKTNTGSASPVVLFTGDLLGHYIPQNFCADYFASQNLVVPATCASTNPGATPIPGSSSETLSSLINPFIEETFAFVAGGMRAVLGTTPVIYVPGNIDTYVGGYGPVGSFLSDNAPTVYSQFLNSSGNQADFLSTFETSGYYTAQPLGSKLLVIGLNSNSFVGAWPYFSSATANSEITWLGQQLEAAQAAGQKVWILMHVPPGANSQEIILAAPLPEDVPAVFENKTDDELLWQWDPTVQAAFISTLNKYPGVVTMMLAGHTHMDEFRILDSSGDVLEQLPGISPCFGNNPAYKILTVTQNTFTPTDYQSFNFNLGSAQPLGFLPLYQFSTTYGAQSTLGSSLQVLYPKLNSSQSTQDMYTYLYSSGSEGVNPSTQQPWNPITEEDWPIFGCTIGQVTESGYVACVDPPQ